MLTDKEIAEIEERIDHIPYHVLSRETCNDLEKVFSTVKEQRQKLFVQDMELQLLRPLKDKLEDLTSSRIVQSQEIQITDLEEKVKEQRELLRDCRDNLDHLGGIEHLQNRIEEALK